MLPPAAQPQLIDIGRVPMVMVPATWTYQQDECSLIERGIRIRAERPNHRRQIQKLTWKDTNNRHHHQQQQQQQVQQLDVVAGKYQTCHRQNGHHHLWMPQERKGYASVSTEDVVLSPAVALRRILALFENCQFRDAANLIALLDHVTFRSVLVELPVDLLIDAMPKTLPLFEALYTKAFLSDADASFTVRQLLQPDALVMQMVKHFAKHDAADLHASVRSTGLCTLRALGNGGGVYPSCSKILKVIASSEPKIRHLLHARRRAMDRAIEGLGQHGLVGTSDEMLMSLHDALRLEFDRVIHSYKAAVQKLDELSLVPKFGTITSRSVYRGPAPINASHQRQLSLKQNEIQERLIKNKTLLNVIEPIVENRSLNVFMDILRRRVEHDKDVLFQFTQLKREAKDVNPDSIVAPVLMRFSYGCDVVLHLLREAASDDDDDVSSDDPSGYHSDSDSAIVVGRYNLFYRSARSTSRTSGGGRRSPSVTNVVNSQDGHSQDVKSASASESNRSRGKYKKSDHVLAASTGSNGALPKGGSCPNCSAEGLPSPIYELEVKKEVEALRCDLMKARQTITTLQDREQKLKERLAEQSKKIVEQLGGVAAGSSSTFGSSGGYFENAVGGGGSSAGGEKRPTILIRRYGNLYAQARVDTLDALDSLSELHDAEELKSKLLFSVIVLAFRSVHSTMRDIRDGLRRLLQMPDVACDPHAAELDASVAVYLRKTIDRYDVKKNVEEVCSQIWATLYDYPCLKTCEGLVQYICDCVKLAWGLVNQTPPFVIEYETRTFRRDMHVRFHTSNQDSEHIKTYLWPALLEKEKGPCVHKGVIIT